MIDARACSWGVKGVPGRSRREAGRLCPGGGEKLRLGPLNSQCLRRVEKRLQNLFSKRGDGMKTCCRRQKPPSFSLCPVQVRCDRRYPKLLAVLEE